MPQLMFCILYRNTFFAYVSLFLCVCVTVFSSLSLSVFKKRQYSVKQRPDCIPPSPSLNENR